MTQSLVQALKALGKEEVMLAATDKYGLFSSTGILWIALCDDKGLLVQPLLNLKEYGGHVKSVVCSFEILLQLYNSDPVV